MKALFTSRLQLFAAAMALAGLWLVIMPPEAMALAFSNALNVGTCTATPTYAVVIPAAGQGLLSSIVTNIQDVLNSIAQNMFQTIVTDPGFLQALRAAVTLYVAVYGILFTFGMVQSTVHDFMIRLIKIGVIMMLISPDSWTYFNNNVVWFFNQGTDDIINQMTAIAIPVGNATVNSGPPFSVMDTAIADVASSNMAIHVMATFTTGPYGPIIGFILLMSIGTFLKALLNAAWVYIMSLVMKTLLFGLAPIFISCLLFSRTKHLFDGWLNQLVNASLQPILLFTFFAFFVSLITACIQQILNINVCWTSWPELMQGTAFSAQWWRFATCSNWGDVTDPITGVVTNQCLTWTPCNGQWNFEGSSCSTSNPATSPADVTPISIVLPLTMWILADLAGRFNHIVIQIAMEIASSTHDMRMGMENITGRMFGGGGGGGGRSSAPGSPTAGALPSPGGGTAPGAASTSSANGWLEGFRSQLPRWMRF